MIEHYTNKIWQHLHQLNSPAVRCLNEGLTKEEVLAQCEQVNFPVCEEIIALYQWKNGTNIIGSYNLGLYMRDADIFPHFHFNSLEKALEIWRSEFVPEVATQYLNGIADPWQVTWLPIFSDDGDGHYVLDTEGKRIIHIDENWHTELKYNNLEEMLQHIVSKYENKRYLIDHANEGFLTEV
ncbi:MAG: SMI1/KNR4 family protein [Bacteroidia bacterium]